MKTKINPKNIIIGIVVGGIIPFFVLFGLWEWITSDAFPYLFVSKERNCVQEIARQPYVSREGYGISFKNCLERQGNN